jgi:hypothetical protein
MVVNVMPGAARRVKEKIKRMQGNMTEGEHGFTTFAAAEVITSSGAREMWVAAAGKQGYVPPSN